jgi:hypothetical protein
MGSYAAAGALARHRERVRIQEGVREARLAEANRQAGTRPAVARRPPPGRPRPVRPQPPPPRPQDEPVQAQPPQPYQEPPIPVDHGEGEGA